MVAMGSYCPESDTEYTLRKFKLYETPSRYYLVGRDCSRQRWKVLKIDRSEPLELSLYEDPTVYSEQECHDLLNRLAEGNQSSGGLNFVTKAYGIIGFIKFLEPFYMILVTKRRLVGNIRGHAIYGIDESQFLAVQHSLVQTKQGSSQAEHRYKKLFGSIDLTKDFFYSYTYRLMWSLQRNMSMSEVEGSPFEDMFVWNAFLTRGIRQKITSARWTVALMHGFFKQSELCVRENLNLVLTLIARRSRHFAGTRYLKRGVNKRGRVANDVETEQIISEEGGDLDRISSVVQHRGSIPLHWSQETSILSPRPDIKIYEYDPNYEATRLHFQDLSIRYGNPITVLNLVKTMEKKPREAILSREFDQAIESLNRSLPKGENINYVEWDFHQFAKRSSTNVVEVLGSVAKNVLDKTGFYCCIKKKHIKGDLNEGSEKSFMEAEINGSSEGQNGDEESSNASWQRGVLRSNCIDCIDRTNVAQYAFGLVALGCQMFSLGVSDSPEIDPISHLAFALMEIYEKMGDALGVQYGGSAAHNKVFSQRRGKWKATTQYQEFFRSIKRHYNNAYLDGEKQDAIDIFLGRFRPDERKIPLWLLDFDHHLHFRRHGKIPINNCSLSFERSFSVGNITEEAESSNSSPEYAGQSHGFLTRISENMVNGNITSLAKELDSVKYSKHMNSSESLKNISDAEFEEANPFTSDTPPKVLRNGTSDEQGFGNPIEDDWLSLRNSCEEDATERQWSGMKSHIQRGIAVGLKSNKAKMKRDQQDMTNLKYWEEMKKFKPPAIGEYLNATGVSERESCPLLNKDREEIAIEANFPSTFVNWVNCGQTLCR